MEEFKKQVSRYSLKITYLYLILALTTIAYFILKVYSGDDLSGILTGILAIILTPVGFLSVLPLVLMFAIIFYSLRGNKAYTGPAKPYDYKYFFLKTTLGKIMLAFILVSIANFYAMGVLNYRTILILIVLFGILVAFAYLRNIGISLIISRYTGKNKALAIIISVLTLAGILAIQSFAPTIIKALSNPYDLTECFTKYRIENSMTSSCVGRHARDAKDISLCNELHRIYEGNDYVLNEFVCKGVYNSR